MREGIAREGVVGMVRDGAYFCAGIIQLILHLLL